MPEENGNLLGDSNDIQNRFNLNVCYPGSKVPEWFRCRTTKGASIKVEIDKPYSQLLGFCVSCAVSQVFCPYYRVHCEYDLGDGEKYLLGIYYLSNLGELWNMDHVCLWFCPFYNCRIIRAIERCLGSDDDHGTTTWNKTISFTFIAEGTTSRQEDFFIKGCGVLPIYASDVLHLIPELESAFNLNPSHNSMVWNGLQDLDLHALKSNMVHKIEENGISTTPFSRQSEIVMQEKREFGPIRLCHMREAYRRVKRVGEVFKRQMSRLLQYWVCSSDL
ncbi:hypothetical protein PIB30_014954 [Stylosanthes scabra]|uniref:C-JID domain-containing protein n=1 Tax=Stylosanthes scabra TaxID=79078 RepID=A0ABU6W4Z7_9FABA|nr:hypothetical protein [Stylosanthes scabra]